MRAGLAFVVIYFAFDRLAAATGSTRGEVGLAVCAVIVAIAWPFPLAWLFDRARGSIWPGAIVHAVMQGAIKLLVDDGAAFQSLAIAWVALGIGAPWLFFLLCEREPVSEPAAASTPRRR
jgi:hypothetical protein